MKQIFLVSILALHLLVASSQSTNKLVIYADSGSTTIDPNVYGHFAEHLGGCIYGGIWVGKDSPIPNTRGIRNDVIAALKEIDVPVIRWPGGCFADAYHWKDGIGPQENRKGVINKVWGGQLEDNSFGTHEFLDFCELIGAEPYLAINVGSGTVEEASEWVDYVNSEIGPMADLRRENGRDKPWNVKYWGIGNESWGCGGNMTADYYADLYKKFSTFCAAPYKILSGGTTEDFEWTETTMKKTQKYQNLIQGYSYHHYVVCNDWSKKGSATDFDKSEWFSTMQKTLYVEENLVEHMKIMDKYDPEKKISLVADEWGNWFDVEPGTNGAFLYQQNTLRDALTAGLYLNIFNNHADRVRMANLAQTVNVLQAVLLTKGEEMVKTPTFYVFKMYKVHQNATLLPFDLESGSRYSNGDKSIPSINVSASKNSDGIVHISLVNVDPDKAQSLTLEIPDTKVKKVNGEIISAPAMNAFNDYGKEEKIHLNTFDDFKVKKGKVEIQLPAKSIVTLEVVE